MPDISELDETAQRLKVSWRKANNYYASFASQLLEIKRQIESGSYGPGWTFSGWLLKKAGLFESQVMTQLKTFTRAIAAEEREKIDQANIEIAVQKRAEKRAVAARKRIETAQRKSDRAIAKAHKERERETILAERQATKEAELAEQKREAESKRNSERMRNRRAATIAKLKANPPENADCAKWLAECDEIEKPIRTEHGKRYLMMKEKVDTQQVGKNADGKHWTWTEWSKFYIKRSRSSIKQCISDYVKTTSNGQELAIEQSENVVSFPKNVA